MALPPGSAALAQVPGITTSITVADSAAVQQSYVYALRVVALSSLSAIIACICCNDIGDKVSHSDPLFYHMDKLGGLTFMTDER